MFFSKVLNMLAHYLECMLEYLCLIVTASIRFCQYLFGFVFLQIL